MLNWSQAVLLAFHAMALLVIEQGKTLTVQQMAGRLDVSADHLAKVMQKLARAKLVKSYRGPNGGYSLIADPATTPLLTLYECIEGNYAVRDCMLHDKGCAGHACIFGKVVGGISVMVADYLSQTMLSDVATADASFSVSQRS